MATLLIGYDLNKNKDYPALHDAIKALGGAWWHHLDSTWLVRTSQTASQARDALKQLIDADDELLVIDVTGDSRAWKGFNDKGSEWLKNIYE